MIAFARADARRFRAVARRCFANGRPRGPSPPVRLTASSDTVTLAAHLGEVVVVHTSATESIDTDALILPLAAFDAFEGGGPGVVTLEAGRGAAINARWEGGSNPGAATFDAVEDDRDWAAEPDSWSEVPVEFLAAVHEAGRTAAREAARYALGRVQLKGTTGQVIGTDGKQALVLGGFTLPFAEDLLVPAVPVFGAKELAAERDVRIGIAGDWVGLAVGPFRIWLKIDREGCFPDVASAVPRARGTHVEFADTDVANLLLVLAGLPGSAAMSAPVTLDLGPRVVVRAREEGTGPVAQVAMPGSTTTGPPVRVVVSRDHLGRALALGFREFCIVSPERPITARTRDRLYLTAALDPSSAVAAEPLPTPSSPSRRITVPSRDNPPPEQNGHADPPPSGDLVDPLAEAEGLRAALTEATNRAGRLVATLKQFRRERRALASAWSSLKQLNLGP
jgi:hypothetical protein